MARARANSGASAASVAPAGGNVTSACVVGPTASRATASASVVVAVTPRAPNAAALASLRTTPSTPSPLAKAAVQTRAPVNPAPKTTTSTAATRPPYQPGLPRPGAAFRLRQG